MQCSINIPGTVHIIPSDDCPRKEMGPHEERDKTLNPQLLLSCVHLHTQFSWLVIA